MSIENGRRLRGKKYVEILAWILTMVMSNWYVARGFGPSTLGFEITIAGAAEIKQLDQCIATRSNQKSVMSKRAHAVYEVVVCWIFVCGFVGPWRSEIVKAKIIQYELRCRCNTYFLPNSAVTPRSKENIAR
jgi:hypothetical protein